MFTPATELAEVRLWRPEPDVKTIYSVHLSLSTCEVVNWLWSWQCELVIYCSADASPSFWFLKGGDHGNDNKQCETFHWKLQGDIYRRKKYHGRFEAWSCQRPNLSPKYLKFFFPQKYTTFFSKINFGFSVKVIGFRVSFKGFWFWFWILEKMWNIF